MRIADYVDSNGKKYKRCITGLFRIRDGSNAPWYTNPEKFNEKRSASPKMTDNPKDL